MFRSWVAAAALAAGLSGIALAQETPASTETPTLTTTEVVAPPPPVAPKAGEDKVCRRIQETGTRVSSRKVCMSREAWEREDDVARTRHRDVIDRNRGTSSPMGPAVSGAGG
jgi:hypothetical protein